MLPDPTYRPRLRSLEAFRLPPGEGQDFAVRDRSGLSEAVVGLSHAALQLLSLIDGVRTCFEICEEFQRTNDQRFSIDVLASMLEQLDRARFLESPAFERHYATVLAAYRQSGTRAMQTAEALGLADSSGSLFAEMLAEIGPHDTGDRALGIIAPHLDYPRGRPCYGDAYGSLRNRPKPDRVVILGTNHFGRSTAVVGTANDFTTPLGRTETDRDFLRRLSAGCGELCAFELDHQKEHSVELQVAWLQYLFGPDSFRMVAFLCPDPCGPTGTAPIDGQGPDLLTFARELRTLIERDGGDTLIVAGADLSHVGQAFGDDRYLDEEFLAEVRQSDGAALSALTSQGAEAFRAALAEGGNPTRVCSAGCTFALATVLEGRRATTLRYHQAVDQPTQTCVTCAAIVYT